MSSKQSVVAAKKLGYLLQPDFCPRCLWLQMKLNWKMPYSSFPGVFSKLDAAQKAYVTGYLDREGKLPDCLSVLGNVTGYLPSPNWREFYFESTESDLRVRGEADLILTRDDGKLIIVDLKTADAKGIEDPLWQIYQVQANSYARAADERGLGEVAGLALAYMSPIFDEDSMGAEENLRAEGVAIPFKATVVEVPIDLEQLEPLCEKWVEYTTLVTSPEPAEGCKNCEKIDQICQLLDDQSTTLQMATSAQRIQAFTQIGLPSEIDEY